MVGLIKSVDRKFWPAHRIELSVAMTTQLQERKLIVADVGSADGPEEAWADLAPFIHFLTFEPNPRPGQSDGGAQTTNFPIGLWSSSGKRELYITAHPDSSSLLKVNSAFFADYLSKLGMEMVGSAMVDVDTLDNLLSGKPELSPDFLKVDVQGADLEVLKGSRATLAASVLGAKVETSFVEAYVGAPVFGDVDSFMRQNGFVLFDLGRNYWLRNNGLHGYTSEPQLIWGDAIYFLSRERLLDRLTGADEGQRKAILTKFVALLLRHGVHDYTWDIIEAIASKNLVAHTVANDLKAVVKKSMDNSLWHFVKGAFGVLFALGILLVSCPFAAPRTRGIYYLKQRAGRFFRDLTRLAVLGRTGHNTGVSDPFV